MRLVTRFWRDESGSTVTEYALIGGFISVALIFNFHAIGSKINHLITPVSSGLN